MSRSQALMLTMLGYAAFLGTSFVAAEPAEVAEGPLEPRKGAGYMPLKLPPIPRHDKDRAMQLAQAKRERRAAKRRVS